MRSQSLGLDEGMTAAAVLTRAVVRERQVFVLGADGSYDVELNRFFRDLDAWGVRAASSVTAYARDIAVFCRFLEQARGGKSIWVCDAADLAAFKRVRLHGDPERAVSVPTWRRSIAALDKWAAWARYEGLIEELPFRYADKTVWTPNGLQRIRVNAASEPDPGPAPVRFLAFEDYLTWRDVGLAGRLPGGRPDPSWRGLHDERNCLFADLLIFTGMRLGEAASLLVAELPGIRCIRRAGAGDLAGGGGNQAVPGTCGFPAAAAGPCAAPVRVDRTRRAGRADARDGQVPGRR